MNTFLLNYEKIANKTLHKKYLVTPAQYNINIITNIIYNEKLKIVSHFKEWMIFDDQNEFLKRYYQYQESIIKLATIFEFYEENSKIFPNYVALKESKYLFKNIKRKQKMLDNLNEDRQSEHSASSNHIFTSNIIHSLLSNSSHLGTTESMEQIIQAIDDNETPLERVKNTSSTGKHKKFIKSTNCLKPNKKPNKIPNSTKVPRSKHNQKLNIANIEKKLKDTKGPKVKKLKNQTSFRTEKARKNLSRGPNEKYKIRKNNKLLVSSINLSSSIKKNEKLEAKSMPKLTYKDRLKSLGKLTKGIANSKKRITSPQNPGVDSIKYKENNENNNLVKITIYSSKFSSGGLKSGRGKKCLATSGSRISGISGVRDSTSKETKDNKDFGNKYTPATTVSNSGFGGILSGQGKVNSRPAHRSKTQKSNSDLQKKNIGLRIGTTNTNTRSSMNTINSINPDHHHNASKCFQKPIESMSNKQTPTSAKITDKRKQGEVYPLSPHLNTPSTTSYKTNHSGSHKKKVNRNLQSNFEANSIKTKKLTMSKISATRYETYQKTMIHEKNIPSLRISFSNNGNTNPTNKNISDSKSKSPESKCSLSKSNNMNRNSCILKQNNLRLIIHNDVIETSEDGRHTERIKTSKKPSNNYFKSSTIGRQSVQTHKKISSVASASDCGRVIPKTTRGDSRKSFIPNKPSTHRVVKSNHNTVKANSPKNKQTNKQISNSGGNSNIKNTKVINSTITSKKQPKKKIKNFNELVKQIKK